ncbi:MAG: hypothetical protein ACI4V1_09845 [Eubacteriales bacterium]
MNLPLPPVRKEKRLTVPHFPAPFQCVLFRNWGMVPTERIARVIGTDSETACRLAADLGLPPQPHVCPDWLTKGYITILRANWHLLDYDALCTLLDWTPEKLAFHLREDDFLEVKLGGFKPDVDDFHYRPLNESEQRRTEEIRRAVTETEDKLPPVTAQPFDFAPLFALHSKHPAVHGHPRFEERFCYSYCALYGDTFLDRELIDASFPDELLRAYQSIGITGVWTQIILYTMVQFPFAPAFSEGYETRQEGMRYLTEKLAKYGLKLFLYFNEPRSMPMPFFRDHPNLLGWQNGAYGTLCVSEPEVQAYLRDGVAELVRSVPLLGGFFTITASENLTNCYSHTPGGPSNCPKCADKTPAEIFVLVNRLVREGASSVSDTVRVIAWSWGWVPETMPEVVRNLPLQTAVMGVSEQGKTKVLGGTETSVLDYSISIEGPGEYALSTWKAAHEQGLPAYAKLQVNNSWEMAAVPYLPVFEKPYRHLRALLEAGESAPDGLMLSWTLGGYPSPTLEMLSSLCEKSDRIPSLPELYEKIFDGADIGRLTKAFHCFSEAFDAYPFHIGCAYNGPQHSAPANLLYAVPTGFGATMVGYPYDALDDWRSIFPVETYVSQVKTLSDGWNRGLELLREAENGAPSSGKLRELTDCAEVCGCHFRSMYLQCAFLLLRDGRASEMGPTELTAAEILREEEAIAVKTAEIVSRNPTIGYESSNHYFYHRNALLEKVVNCRYLYERLCQ